jgi:aldose 1-epimerase
MASDAPDRVSRAGFGAMPDGRPVEAITLRNRNGIAATIIAYGASLYGLVLPDAAGTPADVVLAPATLGEDIAKRQFMGSSVGRVANRIAGGRFSLDGQAYQVPTNDGANALHGGVAGFDTALWEIAGTSAEADFAEVVLHHVSPDGDQGFPGTVAVEARYRLSDDDALLIEYTATTDRATVVNLTNHAYWNLAGEGSPEGAMEHVLELAADRFLPVDAGLIPTGELRPVEGTPFDFRQGRVVGERVRAADEQIAIGHGYDHNWIVGEGAGAPRRRIARVSEPRCGRGFELWSNQPGVQFYSGNFLDGTTHGKSGRFYRQGDGFVLEPQAFPDTVNRPEFGSCRLAPGESYRNTIIYRFLREDRSQQA